MSIQCCLGLFKGMGTRSFYRSNAYTPQGEPIPTNKRYKAARIFSNHKVIDEIPWYGIEQEYTLLQSSVKWPLGWPVGGFPGPQGPYYCAAGADKSFGRDIPDAVYLMWEYQVGPSVGIEAGDHVVTRSLMLKQFLMFH